MEETLIKVTDDKATLLRPIDATFKVEYKYEGEASARSSVGRRCKKRRR